MLLQTLIKALTFSSRSLLMLTLSHVIISPVDCVVMISVFLPVGVCSFSFAGFAIPGNLVGCSQVFMVF
jgi:hypothetical protein